MYVIERTTWIAQKRREACRHWNWRPLSCCRAARRCPAGPPAVAPAASASHRPGAAVRCATGGEGTAAGRPPVPDGRPPSPQRRQSRPMTLAPGHLDTGGTLTSPLPAQVPGSSEPPRLTDETDLPGTCQGRAEAPGRTRSTLRRLARRARRGPFLAQRFDQGQDVLPVLRAQLVDAGDQQVPVRVAGGVRPAQLVLGGAPARPGAAA